MDLARSCSVVLLASRMRFVDRRYPNQTIFYLDSLILHRRIATHKSFSLYFPSTSSRPSIHLSHWLPRPLVHLLFPEFCASRGNAVRSGYDPADDFEEDVAAEYAGELRLPIPDAWQAPRLTARVSITERIQARLCTTVA